MLDLICNGEFSEHIPVRYEQKWNGNDLWYCERCKEILPTPCEHEWVTEDVPFWNDLHYERDIITYCNKCGQNILLERSVK